MLKTFRKNRKNSPARARIIVRECYETDYEEDKLEIFVDLFCINHCTGQNGSIYITFPNDIHNDTCDDFFSFLKKSKIHFEDFEELVGLTFDAEIYFDDEDKPVLCNKQLVARPPKR